MALVLLLVAGAEKRSKGSEYSKFRAEGVGH